MLCKCYWIVLYTVHFIQHFLQGAVFAGHTAWIHEVRYSAENIKYTKLTRSQAVARIAKPYCLTAHYLLAIVAIQHLQLFSRYWALSVLESRLDLSGSRDIIGHVTIRLIHGPFLIGGPISLTVSEIFNSECDALVDMTLTTAM